MVEAKVRLSFMVPGATMLSSQECDENPKENCDFQKLILEGRTKKGKSYKTILNLRTRKSKPAKQAIIISKEAYEYMISDDGKPEQAGSKLTKDRWLHMNTEQRLRVHMQQIAEALGGFNPMYEVLDD